MNNNQDIKLATTTGYRCNYYAKHLSLVYELSRLKLAAIATIATPIALDKEH